MLLAALLVVLELGARALRLPVYPGVALLEVSPRLPVRALFGALLVGMELLLQSTSSWPAVLAAVTASVAMSMVGARVRRGDARAAITMGVMSATWSTLAALGARQACFGIDALLTALLVRALETEGGATLATRVLMSAWVVANGALFARGARWLVTRARHLDVRARHRPAPGALGGALVLAGALVLTGCGAPARTSLEPPPFAGDGELVVFLSGATQDATRMAHPVIPRPDRTDARCRGCHEAKVTTTNGERERKGFHELHAQSAPRFGLTCSACHVDAGEPGFPGPSPGLLRRRSYNQRCTQCHSDHGAPRWPRRSP